MTKKNEIQSQAIIQMIQSRAVCKTCDYVGAWHEKPDDAKRDAINHWKEPGNEYHIVDILTQQTMKNSLAQ
jgi:hypothetical protein